MGRRNRYTNKHHIVPQARCPNDRTVELDKSWHDAWHKLFGELTPAEAKEMIDIVMRENTRWTHRQLSHLRDEIKAKTDAHVARRAGIGGYWKHQYNKSY